MQFYVLSPIFILTFWKSARYGYALAGGVFSILTFLIGYLVVEYDIPPYGLNLS